MAKLTIGRMAKLYGLHRSTLHEAVAKGRVSVTLDNKGNRLIDLSEMIRVYGEAPSPYTSQTPPTLPDTQGTLASLLEEISFLRKEVRDLRDSLMLISHSPEPKTKITRNGPTSWSNLLEALDD